MEDKTTITTPGGMRIDIRNYVTGLDRDAFERIMKSAASYTLNEKNEGSVKIDLAMENDLAKAMIERFVLSVDDIKENIAERIGNLRLADYDFVLAELKEITKEIGLDDAKKKIEGSAGQNSTGDSSNLELPK